MLKQKVFNFNYNSNLFCKIFLYIISAALFQLRQNEYYNYVCHIFDHILNSFPTAIVCILGDFNLAYFATVNSFF